MEIKPKVSIIIPVYNAESFLEECLESAIGQTIDPKEIICINDGSTDASQNILEKYAAKYSYIKLMVQENMGAGPARNLALNMSRGEFVCFLDADDYYDDPKALDVMYNAAKRNCTKVCGAFRKTYDVNDNYIYENDLFRNECNAMSNGILLHYMDFQSDFDYQNYIFDRQIIIDNNISFPKYRRYQDPPFFVNIMLRIKDFYVVPVELYTYRYRHQDALATEKNILDCMKGMRDVFEIAKENNMEKLQESILYRINYELYPLIVKNMDEEMREILISLDKNLIKENEKVWPLYFIEHIDEEIKTLRTFHDSYKILESIFRGHYDGYNMGRMLFEMGFEKGAIYGLGWFGKVIYEEVKDSGLNIVYGIDKKQKSFYEVDVFSDINEIKECDVIIVTPIENNNSLKYHIKNIVKKKNYKIAVYGIMDLMYMYNEYLGR